MYDSVVRPVVDEVLQGYNCTVFAYGQTVCTVKNLYYVLGYCIYYVLGYFIYYVPGYCIYYVLGHFVDKVLQGYNCTVLATRTHINTHKHTHIRARARRTRWRATSASTRRAR